jgi:Putative zinc-finger
MNRPMARCTSEPISWLRLERYHLGDIRGDERAEIEKHLAACPACAACLERIEQDEAVALPALPVRAPAKVVRMRWPVQAVALVGTLAAAAAVLLAIRGAHPVDGEHPTLPGTRVKGDAFAFTLVRDDAGRVAGTEGTYREHDRFKAIVTCPPGAGGAFDVVVYDASGVSFPLEPAGAVACGNEVPLPGAFRLTGPGDETVCLVWSAGGAVDRGKLASGPDALSAAAGTDGLTYCKKLSAAR